MKKILTIPSLAFILAFLWGSFGCKKNNSASNVLIGQWKQINTSSNTPSYLIISSDMTVTGLTTSSNGGHEYSKKAYRLESNTVLIDNTLYQYSKSGDTLKLLQNVSNPGSTGNYILIPDASIPTLDTWMPMATYSISLPWPDLQMDAITTVGNTIWTIYTYSGIKAYNTSTAQYTAGFSLPDYSGGIEAVGSDLWVYNTVQRKLQKVNPATESVTFTSPAVPDGYGDAGLLAYDGANSIYFQSGYKLDIYNIATNSFNAYQMPQTYADLAFANGYLYGINYSRVDKLDPATLKIVATYRLKDGQGSDVLAAAGGSDFWIYVSDGLQTPGRFQKITLN